MRGYVVRRLASAVPLILLVLTCSFFLVRLAPGSPFDKEAELPAEVKANLAAQYGLDKPLAQQYALFLQHAVQGDFGNSYTYKDRKVSEIIGEAFPISAKLGLLAMAFAIVLGVALGTTAALRQNSWADYLTMGTVMLGKSIPPMVLAPVFVTLFSLTLQWLPVAGWGDGSSRYLIGPVVCLGLYDVAAIARLSRGAMLEVLRSKYVTTARAKGISETRVVVVHALREAVMPLITYLGPALSSILIGTVVVEQVFNIPGLGRYLVSAATNRDYTLVLGISCLACTLIIVSNALADVALGLIDPRIRLR